MKIIFGKKNSQGLNFAIINSNGKMKYLFLMLCSTSIFYQSIAEEAPSPESPAVYSDWIELTLPGWIELTAPPSFYTDDWDPKEKLPLMLPGIRVKEGNLIVDLDKAIKESREKQDLLRSESSWLSETSFWPISVESLEKYYEEIEDEEESE